MISLTTITGSVHVCLPGRLRFKQPFVKKMLNEALTMERPHRPHSNQTYGSCNRVMTSPSLRFGSGVALQKLRLSKWFSHAEERIFCAVIETGFILELKEIDLEPTRWAIVEWVPGYEKSKNRRYVKVHTLLNGEITEMSLGDFWQNDTTIRINNSMDTDKNPHNEITIRNNIKCVRKVKNAKWDSDKEFVHWCKYYQLDDIKVERKKKTSVVWNNISVSAALTIIKNTRKRRKQ